MRQLWPAHDRTEVQADLRVRLLRELRGLPVKRDWAVHPGEVLGEKLEELGMTQSEFADRMDLSRKHVSQIIRGRVRLTVQIAIRAERVLGISAALLVRMQADYDLWKVQGGTT